VSLEETITWHDLPGKLPDADTTVLVHVPECDEPVWLGWYDGVYWFGVDGVEFEDGQVKRWANLPTGGGPAA